MGHSEDGLIAPMAAVEDSRIDYIVTLAGPDKAIAEMMVIQNKLVLQEQGLFAAEEIEEFLVFTRKVYSLIDLATPKEKLSDPLRNFCNEFYYSRDSIVAKQYGSNKSQFYQAYGFSMFNPWFRWFINYDPAPTIEKLTCPTLALNGNMDIQVAAGPNLDGFRAALRKSKVTNYKVLELDSLNHLFQKVKTSSTKEYYRSPETFFILNS